MRKIHTPALVAGALLTTVALGQAIAAAPAPAAASGYKILDRIAIPDGNSDYLAVDGFAKRVLIAKGSNIVGVDIATGKVTPSVATAMGSHIALAVDGGKQLAITNGGGNTVSFAEAKTGAPLASVPAPNFPDSAGIDPASGYVLAASHSAGVLTVIDPVSHTVKGSVTIGGTLEGVVSDGAGRAYVNVASKGQVAVVDLKTYAVVATYSGEGCEDPTGIVYDKVTNLLVSACHSEALVLDAKTGKTVAAIKIGGSPDMAGFDQKNEVAFIPSGDDGTLAIISLKGGKPSLLENLPTQAGARAVAVDQDTGKAFIPVSDTAAPAAPGRRGAAVPGTYKLLVVGK